MKYVKKLLKIMFITICIIFFIIVVFAAGIILLKVYPKYDQYRNEASLEISNSTENTFKQNLTGYIYDDSGNLLTELSNNGSKIYLEYDEIPKDVINAFIAIEDIEYWEHNGINIKAIIKVCYDYVISKGETVRGASTITQQLMRNVFITKEVTLDRKIKEICYALEMEKKYSKEDILEFYVNNIFFANNCYGIEAAAEFYFSKSIQELTLSEIAYLCAIPNSPSYYDPLKNKENAISRRNKILSDMMTCGFINKEEYNSAVKKEIVLNVNYNDKLNDYETTYAIDCAIRYLMELDGFDFVYNFDSMDYYNDYVNRYNLVYEQTRKKLYSEGYVIKTSINKEKQKLLQKYIDETLSFDEEITESGQYALQGASTIINNETGKVEAIVGGRTQESSTYTLNRAFQGYRQPGSSIKPLIVYLPALENGYTDTSIVLNIDVDYAKENPEEVLNMNGTPMTLRSALENSKNGVAWRLFYELTPSVGLSYLQSMEFAKIVPNDFIPAASLGGLTYGTTTVEMANAYSCIVNHGEFQKTDCIVSIKNKNGKELYSAPEKKQIYYEEQTDLIIDIMKGVITKGTAKTMKWTLPIDVAGKTGTTNQSKDGWFVGITPDYSMAVWVGYDIPRELNNLYGATYPAEIWKNTMIELVNNTENTKFKTSAETQNDNEKYFPGRDGSELLSDGYTVENYRDDHELADKANIIISNINENNDKATNMLYFEEARALVEQIYGVTLKTQETEKLNTIFDSYLK